MINILIVIMIIVAILLIIAVLIQNPKGGGISSEFGGASTNQMFGVQKTGDILEKSTWGLFGVLMVGALLTVVLYKISGGNATDNNNADINVERPISMPSALPSSTATSPAASSGAALPAADQKAATAEKATPAPVPAKK